MNILAWIVVGLIAGLLANLVMKGNGYGVVGDIIIGIVGAILAGVLTAVVFGYSVVSGLDLVCVVSAFVGAVILIALIRAVSRPERA